MQSQNYKQNEHNSLETSSSSPFRTERDRELFLNPGFRQSEQKVHYNLCTIKGNSQKQISTPDELMNCFAPYESMGLCKQCFSLNKQTSTLGLADMVETIARFTCKLKQDVVDVDQRMTHLNRAFGEKKKTEKEQLIFKMKELEEEINKLN